ncbi:hypothetical protein KEJ17_03480 [Candidatus Bathyarchaeota archaeon]|nr:hypothetical protein [Candidatus Bathyarchaeota archaeon]
MSSWERVVRAMEISTPDKVPLYEMHIPPIIASSILRKPVNSILLHNPDVVYHLMSMESLDLDKINRHIAKELIQLHENTEIDWIRVVPAYTAKPKDLRKIDEHIWIISGKRYKWSGCSLWNMDEEAIYDPDVILEQCKNSGVKVDTKIFDILRYLVKQVKGKFFLSFDADGSWGPIVSNPNLLRHVLVWMYKRPDVVKAIIDFNTKYALEVGAWAIDEGADAIQMCVDYGNKRGPWFSPEMFRKFVKPALKKQCDAFKRRGAFAVLHSDGNITPILSDVVEAGINAYQGIDVIAGMSLRYVKENYGDKICLVGNVDPRILEFGKPEDVATEVERCLLEGGLKGYVLSASANISANTNADNFLYMIEYAKKRGVYADGITFLRFKN